MIRSKRVSVADRNETVLGDGGLDRLIREILLDLLEPLAFVAYTLLATLLAIAGVTLEWIGVPEWAGAVDQFTLWQLYMGLVVLATSITIVRAKLLTVWDE